MPCVFVRLQGCELRCSWCDTPYALEIKHINKLMTFDEIIEKVTSYDCQFILFTGGEPLIQKKVIQLMSILCNLDFIVAVETNGHQDISKLDKRIIKIMDIKCPSSGMEKKNRSKNIEHLSEIDEIKFVVKDITDYEFAKKIIINYNLINKVNSIFLSPVFGNTDLELLANKILEDKLPVRLQIQLHKIIWGNLPGH